MKLNGNFFSKVKAALFAGQLTQGQVNAMNSIFNAWEQIDGKSLDLLAFSLAITYHEVGLNLVPIEENLKYSAKRIMEVWPSRFKTLAAAQAVANSPQKLANKVYGGRLGNTGSNDGWLYRGRGYSQITGKENYAKFAKLLGLDLVNNPDLVLDPTVGAKILILGIRDGLFTGKKLSNYKTFEGARATVNADGSRKTKNGKSTVGKDISGYANKFKTSLIDGIDKDGTVTIPTTPDPKPVTPTNPQKPTNLIELIINFIKAIFGRK